MYEELIKEARIWAPCAMSPVFQKNLITRLADALEAATSVPVQGEPNDDREALKRIAEVASEQRLKDSIAEYKDATSDEMEPTDWELEFWHAGYKSGALSIIEHNLSRATVPDAATELPELRKMAEEAKQNPDGVEWQTFWDRLTEDQIIELLVEVSIARAERDAYLAAIERVRAIHVRSTDWVKRCAACDELFPCTTRAALDEAPEPEWEERVAACEQHGTHCWSCARRKERRRPAGPWLPME